LTENTRNLRRWRADMIIEAAATSSKVPVISYEITGRRCPKCYLNVSKFSNQG
jgi:hypothetical protein